jgi:hypothetical protein
LLPRLGKLVAMLASPHDGERLACVSAMERLLTGYKLSFTDLGQWLGTATADEPRHSAKYGVKRESVPDAIFGGLDDVLGNDAATQRELEIAASLLSQARRLGGLTERQLALATSIIAQVEARSR